MAELTLHDSKQSSSTPTIFLRSPRGSRPSRQRVGRGPSSGRGKTSGSGQKGQKSRSGGKVRLGFEGGQMPLYRRIPRRGFLNARFKKTYKVISLARMDSLFSNGDTVSLAQLKALGAVKGRSHLIKIVSGIPLKNSYRISPDIALTRSAREAILKAGGSILSQATENTQ